MSDLDEQASVDNIFALMDNLYRERKFVEAGQTLTMVPVEILTTTQIVAWLVTCLWPKQAGDTLPGREEFVLRCATEIVRREPQRADALLKGLVP